MNTKNNPGVWDCYAKAAPNEPMFVLLARDPFAPYLVRLWAERSIKTDCDLVKIQSAYECARLMDEWRLTNPPTAKRPTQTLAQETLNSSASTIIWKHPDDLYVDLTKPPEKKL